MKKKLRGLIVSFLFVAFTISIMPLTAFASDNVTAAVEEATSAEVTADSLTATPAVTAAAETTPAPYGVEVALYLMESYEAWTFPGTDATQWSEPKSESVMITEDGTYTLSLTDLVIPSDNLCLCYIKDVAAYNVKPALPSNVPEDLMVITNVFKVNGKTKEVAEGVRTGLSDSKQFDVAYHNDWLDTDCVVNFMEEINSIEITFTVSGITGEPGAFVYAPPTPTASPVVAATTAPASTNDAVETNTATEPLDEDAAKTGNNTVLIIIIAAAAVVVIAGGAVILNKKKK